MGRPPATTDWSPEPALAAFRDGVTVICELSAQFTDELWLAPTPCTEWRAIDLAGHLRCVADAYHEDRDHAPASRLGPPPSPGLPADELGRQPAPQHPA